MLSVARRNLGSYILRYRMLVSDGNYWIAPPVEVSIVLIPVSKQTSISAFSNGYWLIRKLTFSLVAIAQPVL